MTEEKIVFIIPGFRQKPTQKAYRQIAKLLKKEGYSPVPITIPWKQTTISENTEYFLKKYSQVLAKKSKRIKIKLYILGFSFGAMIAFLASTKIKIAGLILCSLSPFFKEDLPKMTKDWRYYDFSQLHCKTLTKKIKAKKVMMLYGKKETKPLIHRVTATYKQLPITKKYLFAIDKTEHNISDKRYVSTIHHVAQQLL